MLGRKSHITFLKSVKAAFYFENRRVFKRVNAVAAVVLFFSCELQL